MLPLDLTALDPDFFVSNTHKWLFVPRACAVVYIPLRNQKLIRTTYPTSHGYQPKAVKELKDDDGFADPGAAIVSGISDGDTPFVKMFEYVGTLDNSPYLCIPAALRFRSEMCGGEQAIMTYCADLARLGAERVAALLGTECLENDEGSLRSGCAMVCVRLPLDASKILGKRGAAGGGPEGEEEITPGSVIRQFWKEMVERYDTFVAVVWWGGAWWARLSAQVYLEMGDFEWVAGVLQEICGEVAAGRGMRVSGGEGVEE